MAYMAEIAGRFLPEWPIMTNASCLGPGAPDGEENTSPSGAMCIKEV